MYRILILDYEMSIFEATFVLQSWDDFGGLKIQRSAKRLLHGCEKFIPALA